MKKNVAIVISSSCNIVQWQHLFHNKHVNERRNKFSSMQHKTIFHYGNSLLRIAGKTKTQAIKLYDMAMAIDMPKRRKGGSGEKESNAKADIVVKAEPNKAKAVNSISSCFLASKYLYEICIE